jgi:competence protein ComEC
MTPSKALFFFLLSFIAGVFISSFFDVPELITYELFFLGAFYFLLGTVAVRGKSFEFKKILLIFALCLIFLGVGILRANIAESADNNLFTNGKQTYASFGDTPEVFQGLKHKLRGIIYQSFSPPHSSILAALTIGDKRYIPKEWKMKLNLAGVRHITAISGMHIIILAGILIWLFIFLGFKRGQAFYPTLLTLWLFISLTGLQPSAVRAGIMGSVFLLSEKLGRQRAAVRTLVAAAAVMLAFNPLLMRYNIGFQLSFLATLGLIYFLPLFRVFFNKIKIFKNLNLSYLLAVSFSAQVLTFPLLVYNFGYVSLVSPIANILIVPFLPFLMGFGFLFLFLSFLWHPLGIVFSFITYLFLNYLIFLVDFFSSLPFSAVTFEISAFWLFFLYAFLTFFLWYLLKKKHNADFVL